jgi:hypothetical protein
MLLSMLFISGTAGLTYIKALQHIYLCNLIDWENMVVFFTQVFVINATLNPKKIKIKKFC